MPSRKGRGKREAGEPEAQGIHGVQGEGNREADRRYREGAKRFAESGRADEAARDAADSLSEEDRETDAPDPDDEPGTGALSRSSPASGHRRGETTSSPTAIPSPQEIPAEDVPAP